MAMVHRISAVQLLQCESGNGWPCLLEDKNPDQKSLFKQSSWFVCKIYDCNDGKHIPQHGRGAEIQISHKATKNNLHTYSINIIDLGI